LDRFWDITKNFWGKEYNLLILAGFIGVFAGAAATVFRWMIAGCEGLFSQDTLLVLGVSATVAPFLLPLMPMTGGAIIGLLNKYFPEALRENGIHNVIEAVALRNGKVKKRSLIVCAVTSSITIGSGGSAGRVGPTIQIGASIGSALGQWFSLSTKQIRVLVGCGAAAGIAATFNAPLAGVLFALEVILDEFAIHTFSPIVIASVMGTVAARALEGNELIFNTPVFQWVHPVEIGFYLVLGLLCGLIGRLMVRSFFWSQDFFEKKVNISEWMKPALGGLIVGMIAFFLPEVKGNGFPVMEQVLNGQMIWGLTLALIVFKLLATVTTLGSGGIGGFFAPSLFVGAMTGATFGMGIHTLFPTWTAPSETYAFIAMGALISAILQAPLTAILVLFEMTSDYTLILPIMGCCIVSTYTYRHFNKNSLYIQTLLNQGLDIRQGRAVSILSSIYVRDVMDKNVVTLPETLPLEKIVQKVSMTRNFYYPVVDAEERMTGILSFSDIREALLKNELAAETTAGELATDKMVLLTPNYNLNEVMHKFEGLGIDQLPVVQVGDSQKVIGLVNRAEVMAVYNREIMIQQMEQ